MSGRQRQISTRKRRSSSSAICPRATPTTPRFRMPSTCSHSTASPPMGSTRRCALSSKAASATPLRQAHPSFGRKSTGPCALSSRRAKETPSAATVAWDGRRIAARSSSRTAGKAGAASPRSTASFAEPGRHRRAVPRRRPVSSSIPTRSQKFPTRRARPGRWVKSYGHGQNRRLPPQMVPASIPAAPSKGARHEHNPD
ncbi:MAG: hypothetical protein EOS38_01410 [Mesorhizobium sp.]|nr:MAG: hypothetical protein EOS38_01410 [Mesorhizobium sp.]